MEKNYSIVSKLQQKDSIVYNLMWLIKDANGIRFSNKYS